MGVKSLQYFVENCCPEACETVDLREMARQHRDTAQQHSTTTANNTSPTLVVDGMACLRHWYTCRDWVCGGQWREYMALLENWVKVFTSAGIRLVFFFDGVVEEQKRQEWVKRRRRVNGEVFRLFRHIKSHGEQPGRELFCLPSGLASFTPYALRSLGQEVFSTVREADQEIASYARHNGSMGILGQDSDFLIYDSAPYLSVAKLRLDSLTTILYDRDRFSRAIGLAVPQLPLLACLLGNDVVSEERMHQVRSNAVAAYRRRHPPGSGSPQGEKVLALAQLVSSVWGREEGEADLVPRSLALSGPDRDLVERGVRSYLLPREEAPWAANVPSSSLGPPCVMERYVTPEILKACRERHVSAEDFLVYGVLFEGVLQCSNTLEDEDDTELLPQALVYLPCRRLIYGLLLPTQPDSDVETPAVREWFVYPGNPLKGPDVVYPAPLNRSDGQPDLEVLWFANGPEVPSLRLACFLSVFSCQELAELHGTLEHSLLAALCLVTYIALQVQQLSMEDVEAYLSQAVCLRLKSLQELQHIKLPYVCSRAVQLGSLYVRGLGHLFGANCASGRPLPSEALMPWHSFDGRLFHSKYLLAHTGTTHSLLLENNASSLSLFLSLREKVLAVCSNRGRTVQAHPRPRTAPLERGAGARPEPTHRDRPRGGPTHRGHPLGDREGWRERGQSTGDCHQHGQGLRERGETRGEQTGYRGGEEWRGGEMRRGHQQPAFHPDPHLLPHQPGGSFQNMGAPPPRSRGRARCPNRGRRQLAPRWSQPPGAAP